MTISLTIVSIKSQALLTTQPQQMSKLWESKQLGSSIIEVTWNPNGSKLVVVGHNGLDVFSSNGTKLWESDFIGGIYSVVMSPDGRKIAINLGYNAVSSYYGVMILDDNGKKLWESEHWNHPAYNVAWSPDGRKIAIGGKFGIIVYDDNGRKLWEYKELNGEVRGLAWSPDGSKIAVGMNSKNSVNIIVFDANGNELWRSVKINKEIITISWNPKGSEIAVSGYFGIKVFDVDGNKLWESNTGSIYRAIWNSFGTKLAISGFINGVLSVAILDNNGNILWSTPVKYSLSCLTWSPNGSELAVSGQFYSFQTVNKENEVVVYNENGDILWNKTLKGIALSIDWSPDGRKIAIGGVHVVVFDKNGNMLWESDDIGNKVNSITWSPDGSKLVANAYPNIYVLDSSGNLLWKSERWERPGILISWNPDPGISWSSDGSKLAVEGSFGITVYSGNGTRLWKFNGRNALWSPVGDKLVIASPRLFLLDSQGHVLWNESVCITNEENTTVCLGGCVSWSPDGRKIAVGGGFGVAVISDNGTILWSTTNLNEPAYSVAWSPDGSKLAEGTWDKVIVWGFVPYGRIHISGPLYAQLNVSGPGGKGKWILKSRNLTLYASPGVYNMEYEIPMKSLFIGSNKVLSGSFTVQVERDKDTSVVLPAINELVGIIKIYSPITANLTIKWTGGSKDLKLLANGTLQMYAAPGNYTLDYEAPYPADYIGDSKVLTRTLNVTVAINKSVVIRLPSYNDLLGRVVIDVPRGTKLSVKWSNGTKEFGSLYGSLAIRLDPGNYTFEFTYNNVQRTRNITISPGEEIILKYSADDFKTPTYTTTTSTQSSSTTSTIPNTSTMQGSSNTETTQETLSKSTKQESPHTTTTTSTYTITIIVIIIIALLSLLLLKR